MGKVSNNGIRNLRDDVVRLVMRRPLVRMSSSWTNESGIVDDTYIVIHSASPATVSEIVSECVMVSLSAEGLLIPTYNGPTE